MDPQPEYDESTRRAALEALLNRHPNASLAAVTTGGHFIPVPESIPLEGHQQLVGKTALDVTVQSDRAAVIRAWERTRAIGAARVSVHLGDDPDKSVTMHMVDVKEDHGVIIMIITPDEEIDGRGEVTVVAPVANRLCKAKKDDLAVFTEIDDAFTELLGWSKEEIVGSRSLDLIHPDDHDAAIECWVDMVAAPDVVRRVRLRHRCKDGQWRWFEIANHNLLDHPDNGCVVAEMVDVTDEMNAQVALEERDELLKRLAQALPLGLFQVNLTRRILYTNDRLHQLVGVGPRTSLEEQFASVTDDDKGALDAAVALAVDEGQDTDVRVRLKRSQDNGLRHVRITLRPLTSGGQVTGAIACLEDVTESERLRAELEARATSDTLTGCQNRAATLEALDAALNHDKESRDDAPDGPASGVAVIFIDLDRFKPVNDSLGHAAGDELLTIVADRLRSAVRGADIVGRLGGDEFLVVCPSLTGSSEAMTIAARVEDMLHREVSLLQQRIDVRASIGVAWSADCSEGADALIARADAAMYASKAASSGPVLSDPPLPRQQSA